MSGEKKQSVPSHGYYVPGYLNVRRYPKDVSFPGSVGYAEADMERVP